MTPRARTCSRRRLAVPLTGLAAACALLACGCGPSRSTSAVSSVAESHLERDVLDVMNRNGLPVMDSYISCKAMTAGHTQACYGQTNNLPTRQVLGAFDVIEAGHAEYSCPGMLVVTVGGTHLETVKVDPCR